MLQFWMIEEELLINHQFLRLSEEQREVEQREKLGCSIDPHLWMQRTCNAIFQAI